MKKLIEKYGAHIKVLLLLLILFAFLQFIDLDKTIALLLTMNLFFLPLFYLLILSGIVFFVLTYWYLCGKKFSFFETLDDYSVMWGFGLFLPGKIGELAIIPILKKKYKVPYKFATVSTLMPKFGMLFVLFVLAAFSSVILFKDTTLLGLLAVFVVVLIISLVIFKEFIKNNFFGFFSTNRYFKDVYDNWGEFKRIASVKNIIFTLFLALVRVMLVIIFTFLCFVSIGNTVGVGAILFSVAVGQMVAFIPLTINGLGLREGTFAASLLLFGVPLEASASVAIISLVVNYTTGLFFLLKRTFSKKLI